MSEKERVILFPSDADKSTVPIFNDTDFSVAVNPGTPEGEILLNVAAHYRDAGSGNSGDSACVDIIYVIEAQNEQTPFVIDSSTGEISTPGVLYPYAGHEYEYVIIVTVGLIFMMMTETTKIAPKSNVTTTKTETAPTATLKR